MNTIGLPKFLPRCYLFTRQRKKRKSKELIVTNIGGKLSNKLLKVMQMFRNYVSIKTLFSFCFFVTILTGSLGLNTHFSYGASVGKSGLPLPRFVSLKAKRVNMRVGPGRDYKVEWLYTKRGLPLEILQEYGNWRKIRDSEGSEGWILQSLLSGQRTALVTPWKKDDPSKLISLKSEPSAQADEIAKLEPGVLARIENCMNGWCELKAQKIRGYAEQNQLWGVYPDETLQ